MNYTKFLKTISLFIVLLFGVISCSRDSESNGGSSSDPFIGNWRLKVVTYQGQSQDVSNTACWKDTNLVADKSNAKFTLIIPNSNGGGCQNTADSYQWTKKDGTYYYTENGQQQVLPIKLLDNNATLQLTLTSNGTTMIFSFRK